MDLGPGEASGEGRGGSEVEIEFGVGYKTKLAVLREDLEVGL